MTLQLRSAVVHYLEEDYKPGSFVKQSLVGNGTRGTGTVEPQGGNL